MSGQAQYGATKTKTKTEVTGLPSWWLADSDDVCNWDSTTNFIECDDSLENIVTLVLDSQSLEGSLKSDIKWPNTIEIIDLSNNSLTGTFDMRGDILPNALQELDIEYNNFDTLVVSNNSVHGNLTRLTLSDNDFSEWDEWIDFGSFTNLQQLYLDNCSLQLSVDWSVFPASLTELQIADNLLYGNFDTVSYEANGLMLEDLYLS